MKLIKLTQGKFAKVDDDKFEELNKYKWHTRFSRKQYYAMRSGKKGNKFVVIRMHNQLINPPKGKVTDHINGDTLDNRMKNLRIGSHKQNCRNRGKPSTNTSGFKGVSWHKQKKKWCSQICVDYKDRWLGAFDTKEEAYEAYCVACIKYHKNFARI